MKGKNMVLLALAVGMGLVAAFVTAKLGAGQKTPMVPVLVAAKNLDQGAKIEKIEELFVRKPFPKESVPPEFIDDVALIKGKTLQRSVRAGSHITLADVTPRSSIELPVDPKTGTMYKAMAIRVAPETTVGGLVLPGARVDVLSVERGQNGKTVSAMILQNVLVVGVNENTARPEDAGYIKNAQTVTLAVKQSEGLVLALAQKRGEVFLMLRSPDDDKVNKNLKMVTDYVHSDRDADRPTDEGGVIEKTRILVAKDTVPVGTKLTDPEQYFTESEHIGTVPGNFVVKAEDLRGKTVMAKIPANSAPTREHFDEEASPTVATSSAKPTQRHTMTIQVGGSSPFHAQYLNGKLVEPTPPNGALTAISPTPAPTPTPDAPTGTDPETKADKSGPSE